MSSTVDRWRARSLGILLMGLGAGVVASPPAEAVPTITITVANAGTRAIDGMYLSLYTDRGWGPDQLSGVSVAPGASFVVTGVACATGSLVVIAEDEGGCFLYRSVACSGDATWTITSATTRDCGR